MTCCPPLNCESRWSYCAAGWPRQQH
ncbi:hypothetical protein AB0M47_12375 [Hamadaea sp. NPDC051192]